MKTKRILSFVMSLVMVLSVFSGLGISAAAWDADNAPSPSISTLYDSETKELRVDISLENMAETDSADIFLEYDSDVLEYVSCTTYEEELDDDITVEAGCSEAGQVSAVITTSSEQFCVDSINLATFIFRKIDADAETMTITLGRDSNISGSYLPGSSFKVNIADPADDDDENIDDNLIVVSKYSDITNNVTIDIYVRANETSEIFLTYPDDTLEVVDIQPGINYTGLMNAADITEDGRYFSAVSAVLDEYEGGIIHAATYTFNKLDDSEYVYIFTGEESAIDGEPIYGEFKIPLVNRRQAGNVTLETSYNEETDEITLDVYADNVEETACIFFDYSHEDFEYVSAEADDSDDKIKTIAGVTTDDAEYLSCTAMSSEAGAFNQPQHIATFVLKKIGYSETLSLSIVDGSTIDDEEITGDFYINFTNEKSDGYYSIDYVYDAETNELTVKLYAHNAKETALALIDYDRDELEFISGEVYRSDDCVSTIGETTDENEYISCASMTDDGCEFPETFLFATLTFEKLNDAEEAEFTILGDSEIDGLNILEDQYYLDLISRPYVVLESSFDAETRTLTLDAYARNMKGHSDATVFIDFPSEDVEFIEAWQDIDSNAIGTAGLTTDETAVSAVITATPPSDDEEPSTDIDYDYDDDYDDDYGDDVSYVFEDNVIHLGTFTFSVAEDVDSVYFFVNSDSVYDEYSSFDWFTYTADTKFVISDTPAFDIHSFKFNAITRELTITVGTVEAMGYWGASVNIGYDPEEVTYISGEVVSHEEDYTTVFEAFEEENAFNVSMISSDVFAKNNIDMATVKFKVADGIDTVTFDIKDDSAYNDDFAVLGGIHELLIIPENCPHEETAVIPGTKATCTTAGSTDATACIACGEILVASEPIPALGHKDETVKGKAATCTEKGLTDGTKCSVCGEITKAQTEIPASGHKYVYGICSVCGANDPAYKLEVLEKHDKNVTVDKDKNIITVIPGEANSFTAAQLKAQFGAKIELKLADDALIPNGTKFTFNNVEYTIIIKGDTVADGKITAADARAILRIAAKLDNPDEATFSASDINSDAKVSTAEARNVLRFVAKLSSSIEG